MRLWRLTRPEYVATALSGEGSARYPGRWNPRGVRIVYASETLSLATLEVLAHAENLEMLNAYVALELNVPDDSITTLTPSDLPADWQDGPIPDSTRRLGLTWLDATATLMLKVPSVLIPIEHDVLINPSHPRIEDVRVAGP